MKYKISNSDILTWICLYAISLIFLIITIYGLLGKNINALAVEIISTFICTILLVLSIISLPKKHNKKISIDDSTEDGIENAKNKTDSLSEDKTNLEAPKTEENQKNSQLNNQIKDRSQHFDFISTTIGCAMQIFMLSEQIFLDFFAKHPNAVMFRKVVDLFSTALACSASAILLTYYIKKHIQHQNQEGKHDTHKTYKHQMIVSLTILCCSCINFIGKALGSFVQSSKIPLSTHSTLRVDTLLRSIGIAAAVAISIISVLIKPHQTLTHSNSESITKIPQQKSNS